MRPGFVDILTRTAHYPSFAVSGTGYNIASTLAGPQVAAVLHLGNVKFAGGGERRAHTRAVALHHRPSASYQIR